VFYVLFFVLFIFPRSHSWSDTSPCNLAGRFHDEMLDSSRPRAPVLRTLILFKRGGHERTNWASNLLQLCIRLVSSDLGLMDEQVNDTILGRDEAATTVAISLVQSISTLVTLTHRYCQQTCRLSGAPSYRHVFHMSPHFLSRISIFCTASISSFKSLSKV
jgi:hypothetical protein